MKLKHLILILLSVCGVNSATAQSLVLRHRDGTASVVRVTDSLRLQTVGTQISVISGADIQKYDNDDILSITYRKGRSDVNRDFRTDISDVVAIINDMANISKQQQAVYTTDSDVNGDGKTDISDVVAVINVMAGQDHTPLPVVPAEGTNYYSETGSAFYIYRNDGDFNAFLRADADSISFKNGCQLVHTEDSTFAIPFAAIDSVSFITPQIKYKDNVFHITEAHLPYVISADEASVTFSTNLPAKLRPAVGLVMVSDTFDEPFEDGFMGTISSITETGQGLVVSCSEAKVTDVFDELVMVGKVVATGNDNISKMPPKKKISPKKITKSGEVFNIEIPGTFEFKIWDFLKIKDKITLSCDWYLHLSWGKLIFRGVVHADHDMDVEFKLDTDLIKKANGNKEVEPMWLLDIPLFTVLGILDLDLSFGLFLEPKVELAFTGTLPVQLHQTFGFEVNTDDIIPIKPVVQNKATLGDLEASLSMEGKLFTGIAAKLRAMIISEDVLSGNITGRFGPEFGANFSATISSSDVLSNDINAYTIFKESKLSAGLKADAKAKFKIFSNQWPKEKDDSEEGRLSWKWDWKIPGWDERYFVPDFTKPELPNYYMRDALSLYTVPSRDLITDFGYHVGIAVFDKDGNKVLENYNQDTYKFEVENKVNPSVDISQLTPGETYRCVPMLLPELKAAPSFEFTVPKKMAVTKNTVSVDVGNTQTIALSGGWGVYRIINESDIVNAYFDKTNMAKRRIGGFSDASLSAGGGGDYAWYNDGGNEESSTSPQLFVNEKDEDGVDFPVRGLPIIIEGMSAGNTTITIEDIRSGYKLNVDVTVGGESNSVLTISTSSLDFGTVKVGGSKTMHFTVTNSSTESVTFTVGQSQGNFTIAESGKTFTLFGGGQRTINVTFSSSQPDEDYTGKVIILCSTDNKEYCVELYAQTIPASSVGYTCPDENHPHAIDMGKAGIWSCCNVGASVPWEYGGYYAWGETEEKESYSWKNFVHCDGSYNTCHYIGDDISGTQYDVAHIKWGGRWCMPSIDQIGLLIDNCTSEWINVNGINGKKFTAPSGNTIFMPAAGNKDSSTNSIGSNGEYYSSSQYPDPDFSSAVCTFFFSENGSSWSGRERYRGRSVRPVYE